jgi:molybdopterin converting factor subunit 1
MKIRVLFFGMARDIANMNSVELEVDEDSNVSSLRAVLEKNYPKFSNSHEFSIAVNEEYAENATVLKNNDVVAVIPPVSGG